MTSVIRSKASYAWLVLICLTVLSWMLGTDHALGPAGHTAASVVIVVAAVFKVRLIGLYFMELNAAPWLLRGLFEGYCILLLAILLGFYAFG